MPSTASTAHSTACRAYAIGCAIKNIRDAAADPDNAAWAAKAEPVTTGDAYLADDLVPCICARVSESHARWVIPSLAALDAAR